MVATGRSLAAKRTIRALAHEQALCVRRAAAFVFLVFLFGVRRRVVRRAAHHAFNSPGAGGGSAIFVPWRFSPSSSSRSPSRAASVAS